ncbi:MAG: hypothetical protein ACKO5C_00265, partial [Ferruginibacter sp.]
MIGIIGKGFGKLHLASMHLDIHDHTTLLEIQDTYSKFYPYLSICFFTTPHGRYESSEEPHEIDLHHSIGDIRKTHLSIVFEIQPTYRARDVERAFQDKTAIGMQIMMKGNEGWEQTTGLDDLTLKELNQLGLYA